MTDFLNGEFLPRIPIGDWFADIINWINNNFKALLDFISWVLEHLDDGLANGLKAVPVLVIIIVIAALAMWARSAAFGLFTLVALLIVRSMGTDMWDRTMDTISLTLVAAIIAMIIALPLGVLAASNGIASGIIRPIMDFMQTMPAFVYLIPTLFFFSIGVVPGIVSTIIFAMPPGVRLTELGIRQVDPEVVEAAQSFGTPPSRTMTRIKLPLATPTIMAGVNQVIMLSLSMVVIAGMVGAGGLGELVYEAVTRFKLAQGFESGLAVVVIAIILDRLTAALSEKSPVARAEKAGK